jgi:hypothetical protein
MRRREFIALLGGAAAWPVAALAQQSERVRLIGVLMAFAESDPAGQSELAVFRDALKKLGGRKAIISGSNFAGAPVRRIGSRRSQKSWSICDPTRFSV